jgi:hypothetical protein
MNTVWVSPPTIIIISLGFAGLLGEQIRQLRSHLTKRQLAAALALVGLVMLPPLSLPPVIQWLGWAAASLVIALFTFQPKVLPESIFSRRFAWQYACFAMLLAALWNLLAGPGLPYLIIFLAAIYAALLSWKRSRSAA